MDQVKGAISAVLAARVIGTMTEEGKTLLSDMHQWPEELLPSLSRATSTAAAVVDELTESQVFQEYQIAVQEQIREVKDDRDQEIVQAVHSLERVVRRQLYGEQRVQSNVDVYSVRVYGVLRRTSMSSTSGMYDVRRTVFLCPPA